jgi:hypothetical protein
MFQFALSAVYVTKMHKHLPQPEPLKLAGFIRWQDKTPDIVKGFTNKISFDCGAIV